jgi:hypothetical protein
LELVDEALLVGVFLGGSIAVCIDVAILQYVLQIGVRGRTIPAARSINALRSVFRSADQLVLHPNLR